jgi:hypothetical protein
MSLNELLEEVKDQETLLHFVDVLAKDRANAVQAGTANPSSVYDKDAGGWENTTIESFLEAAASWARDTNFGESQGLSPVNPWKQFAVFLYCGKIYE